VTAGVTMALAQKRHKRTIARQTRSSKTGTASVPAFTAPTATKERVRTS